MSIAWMQCFDQFGSTASELLAGIFSEQSGITLANASPAPPTRVNRYVRGTSSLNALRRNFGSAKTTVGFYQQFYIDQYPGANTRVRVAQFRDAANAEQLSVNLTSTGALQVRRGSEGGTQIGITADGIVPTGRWTTIDVKVFFSQTVGTVDIQVNGVNVLALTGQDTCQTSNVEASQIMWGKAVGDTCIPCTASWVHWDLTTSDPNNAHADFIGNKTVITSMVASDTVDADWVPSTGGQGWAMLDEQPASALDYVEATTVGDLSRYGISAVPSDIVSVLAIELFAKSLKTDAGDGSMRLQAVSNGDVQNFTSRPMSTSGTYYPGDVTSINPDTGVAWTPAQVTAMLLGIERTL